MKELEKEASELRQIVESLWERLDIPDEQRKLVLDKVESFRQQDIDTVSVKLQLYCTMLLCAAYFSSKKRCKDLMS